MLPAFTQSDKFTPGQVYKICKNVMDNLTAGKKSHFQGISELLTYVEQDAVTSRDCLEVGVMTNTAKRASDYLTDPPKRCY